jgi:hypothetical protein
LNGTSLSAPAAYPAGSEQARTKTDDFDHAWLGNNSQRQIIASAAFVRNKIGIAVAREYRTIWKIAEEAPDRDTEVLSIMIN